MEEKLNQMIDSELGFQAISLRKTGNLLYLNSFLITAKIKDWRWNIRRSKG